MADPPASSCPKYPGGGAARAGGEAPRLFCVGEAPRLLQAGEAPWPPHPHIPGQTPRHPEGAFEALRATARPGMDEGDLAASPAFRAGLDYLHAGFFWESHEVLEPVWMALPPGHPARHLTQALIQIANARLKDRMGRPQAAARLRGLAFRHLTAARDGRAGPILGLDPDKVQGWISDSA